MKAYDYFSSVGDPNLARVVQYAAFYQIARRFGIQTKSAIPAGQVIHDPLSQEFRNIIDLFLTTDEKTLDAKFDEMKEEDISTIDFMTALQQLDHVEELKDLLLEVRNKDGNKGLDRIAEHLSGAREHVTQQLAVQNKLIAIVYAEPKAQQEKTFEELTSAKHVVSHLGDADPKPPFDKFSPQELDELAIDLVAREIVTHKQLIRIMTATSIRSLKDDYEKATERTDIGWIHTPTVVISSNGKKETATGGHNIYAHVTQFRVDNEVAPGRIRVVEANAQKVVLYNVQDEAVIPQVAEIVGGTIRLPRQKKLNLPSTKS